ncbi:MAG: hypothetical protein L0216_20825 [Planctomycetales bacterium]|nr:hypothetical protein [Planctomycetales bacterium]
MARMIVTQGLAEAWNLVRQRPIAVLPLVLLWWEACASDLVTRALGTLLEWDPSQVTVLQGQIRRRPVETALVALEWGAHVVSPARGPLRPSFLAPAIACGGLLAVTILPLVRSRLARWQRLDRNVLQGLLLVGSVGSLAGDFLAQPFEVGFRFGVVPGSLLWTALDVGSFVSQSLLVPLGLGTVLFWWVVGRLSPALGGPPVLTRLAVAHAAGLVISEALTLAEYSPSLPPGRPSGPGGWTVVPNLVTGMLCLSLLAAALRPTAVRRWLRNPGPPSTLLCVGWMGAATLLLERLSLLNPVLSMPVEWQVSLLERAAHGILDLANVLLGLLVVLALAELGAPPRESPAAAAAPPPSEGA